MPKRKKRRSRAKPGGLPKGAYRVPDGGFTDPRHITVTTGKPGQKIQVTSVRREQPDFERLARVLIDYHKGLNHRDTPDDQS